MSRPLTNWTDLKREGALGDGEPQLMAVPVPTEVVEVIERLAEAAGVQPQEFLVERLVVILHFAEHLMDMATSRRMSEEHVPGYL